uniref:Uncharacterized protein n=1 Tax=Lactuca sativa TaxID=4236 RepID=A0A9R1XUN0_LACSA|nr:hypothetical protein LSAT_V11C100033820 [Lactuca sativa]
MCAPSKAIIPGLLRTITKLKSQHTRLKCYMLCSWMLFVFVLVYKNNVRHVLQQIVNGNYIWYVHFDHSIFVCGLHIINDDCMFCLKGNIGQVLQHEIIHENNIKTLNIT